MNEMKPTGDLYSPRIPMTNPQDQKALLKLIEESNELSSASARCLMQGIDESEPITGKVNRQWLEEECADVLSAMWVMIFHFNLDVTTIHRRKELKQYRIQNWLDGNKVA